MTSASTAPTGTVTKQQADLIDELLAGQIAHVVNHALRLDGVITLVRAIGGSAVADHLRAAADQILAEEDERRARWWAVEEARSSEERRRERQWIKSVPCPRCAAVAGAPCRSPSGSRKDDLHKDRRVAAGPIPPDDLVVTDIAPRTPGRSSA
jgi:hypothetical protein